MAPPPTLTDVDALDDRLDGLASAVGVAAGGIMLRLGASRYVVAMADVAEVASVPGVTRVPGGPPWLAGVANWRGRMLPVLDLRPLLVAAPLPLPSSARLVVIARGDVVAGVVAEAVPGVYDGDLADPAAPPPTLGAEAGVLVVGQVADRTGPVAVLDAGAVLALRDRVDRRRHGS
jgi:chemotaxis signal transduction protein